MPDDLATLAPAEAGDLTLDDLLAHARNHPDLPLVFHVDGRAVKAGYHVTEVKAGRFAALDCGANPEAWTEIFVQLWDVDEGARTHMAAGKLAAIIRKVADHVGLAPGAKLTFEFSDGVAPMQLYRAGLPAVRAGQLQVALSPRAASCKPRDRWLAAQPTAGAGACCG
jgi:hypothetical protein